MAEAVETQLSVSHVRYQTMLKKIGLACLFAALGLALGRVRLIGGLSPFGPAFIAACFLSRRQEALFAAAGVCLGALLVPDDTLYIVTVAVLLTVTLLAVGRANTRRWVVVLTAASAYAVAAAVFKTADLEMFLKAVLECLIALLMIYVMSTVIQLTASRRKRTLLTAEESICLALAALVVVCMFGPLSIRGVYIASIIAQLIVMVMAYTGGAALGAGVGLALGLALCFGVSADVTMIGMLGVAGMLGGALRKLKKPGVAFAFVMTVMLFLIAFFSRNVWILLLIETGAATVLFFALPRRLLLLAGRYIDIKTRREFEYRLHTRRFRELTVGRLSEVAEVFRQTGDMFAREAGARVQGSVQISGVLSAVADTTCKDCVFRKSCWGKDFLSTYGVFNRLFIDYEKNGGLDAASVDPAFAKKCYNIKGILDAAENVFSAYLLSLKWQKRIDESRMITGRQLQGVARVVADLGREIDTGFKFLTSLEERVAAALDAAEYRVKEVCAESRAGSLAVGVKLKAAGEQEGRRSIESVVSTVCGTRMRKAQEMQEAGGRYATVRLEQARRFEVRFGVAKLAKTEISGDSFVSVSLKDGRHLLMLCDGMGSGAAAQRESAAAVSLVENFFRAGFDDAVIFDTINRLMLLRGGEEAFTTVDLCVVDLKTGEARFTKIGAESSFVLSSGDITTIEPGSLPMGIVDEVAPVSAVMTLAVDDMIVLLSDGVANEIGEDVDAWFADIPRTEPQETADAILDKALGAAPPRDDMTVLVCRLSSP